jgi:hypothetical protein
MTRGVIIKGYHRMILPLKALLFSKTLSFYIVFPMPYTRTKVYRATRAAYVYRQNSDWR